MKKTVLLLLSILLIGGAFAQKAPSTKLISSSEERIVVNFQLNGFNTVRVQTPQGDQFTVSVPKMAAMLEAGSPDLPSFPIPTIIGDRAEMTVNVIDAQYRDYSNMAIAPSKGSISRQVNPNDVPYTYGDMYQQNAFWPATQAHLEKPYILRDFRGQNIMVQPFAYNPVTKTLRVYESLTIEMTKVSDNGANQKNARKSNTIKIDPENKAQYGRRFINFGETGAKYIFDEDFGEMLIICTDAYMDNLQPLVDWKNQSGRPTTMVSLSTVGGNNIESIKSYVSNLYNDPTHNLEYVLLVGEYNDITPKNLGYGSGGTVFSDNYIGKLEGNDDYLEVLVGRLSVANAADADVQVNKIIYFERDVQEGATWCEKGLGIGAIGAGSGHYGEDDYQHIDLIRDTLLHYTYTTVTDLHQGGGASVSSISNTINQGVSIINYCNHGSETTWGVANYSTSDIAALTNDEMLPIVWSVACLNGKFDVGTCFAEAWLRATNNATNAPTGAVGGMFSFVSQPWQPPMYGQDEMVDILTEWHSADQFNHTFGGASLNGSMYVLDMAPNDSYQTFNAWILFGDPSMMLRTANPTNMNVTMNPSVLMIGMNTLEVSADNTAYGIATLSNAEGIIATAKIIDGSATLAFPALSNVETLTLTVMGFNKVTEIVSMDVLPAEGAFVSVDSFTPGNVPVNEEQLMSITFKNVGVDPTSGTTNVVLSSTDNNITFSDNEGSFGVLAADEMITLTDEFAFTVAAGVPDGTKIQIDVTSTCGSEVWTGKAKITVGAPIVEFDSFEAMGGYTPGESQNIVANFKNIGHYMATNAVVNISSSSEYISFAYESVALGTIDPESTVSAVFNVTISESCPETEVIRVAFELVADNEVVALGTGVLKNTCNVVFELTDSWGDGWNGNQLVVSFDDGTPTQNLTIQEGNSATYTLEIGIGVHVTLGWQNGNYTTECSFTVSYQDGDQITSASGSNLGPAYNFEFDVNCAGDPVITTNDPVTELAYTIDSVNMTVTLTWEAPANKDAINYLVTRNGEELAQVKTNEFTDTDPTDYAAYCVIAQYLSGNSEPTCLDPIEDLLGVEESENNIHIYPNPVNSTLYITDGNAEFSYVMFNGMGQQVAKGTAQGTATVNVSGMSKGVYFLRLTSGSQVSIQKVVVE
ncbi:MAG: T9SS type A sorting domain-containing protein [Bacteroidales bacterium]|nr:T9SS type A sorting domain-containing protein [Bacteroidales bacterium]